MYARLTLLALPLSLAACGDQGTGDFRMPWDKPEPVVVAPEEPKPAIPEPTGVAPTEQPLEIEGKRAKVATAQSETLDVESFVAAGQGWSASVAGGTAKFERPGAKAASVKVQRLVYASGVEYIGVLNGTAFTLNIRGDDCGKNPMTATVRANGNNYGGCAAPGTDPAAVIVPAPAAPAPTSEAAPANPRG